MVHNCSVLTHYLLSCSRHCAWLRRPRTSSPSCPDTLSSNSTDHAPQVRHSTPSADVPAAAAEPLVYTCTRALKWVVDRRCVTYHAGHAAPACEGAEHVWDEGCASGGASGLIGVHRSPCLAHSFTVMRRAPLLTCNQAAAPSNRYAAPACRRSAPGCPSSHLQGMNHDIYCNSVTTHWPAVQRGSQCGLHVVMSPSVGLQSTRR